MLTVAQPDYGPPPRPATESAVPESKWTQVPDPERRLIGTLMCGAPLDSVAGTIGSAGAIESQQYRLIYNALARLASRDVSIEPYAIACELGADLERCGGVNELAAILADVPTAANATYYARLVRDAASARRDREANLTEARAHARLSQALETHDETMIVEARRDLREVIASPATVPSTEAPKLGEDAFHGVAGELVRAVEAHTEASGVAILIQILVAFGSVVGRSAYFVAEADRHFANLFAVLVGKTAKARKGTSWGIIRRVFSAVDELWLRGRVQSGLSSGEGLIWAVRDTVEIEKDGKIETIGPGDEDKRLLAYEAEMASVLRVLARDGNTLSAFLRSAWDTGDLQTMVKNSPARATGAHISIVGHITQDELTRYLTSTEASNGFANRFLWIHVSRARLLPEGGRLDAVDLGPLLTRLQEAIAFGRGARELRRDNAARDLWRGVYPSLAEGEGGTVGALLARAEPQVMRLALVYALLDCSSTIQEQHLRAALAVWEYADQSVRLIFGRTICDPDAERIMGALRSSPAGMSRTQIRDLFGRHRTSEQIDRALKSLRGHRLAEMQTESTLGRSVERWFAVATQATEAT